MDDQSVDRLVLVVFSQSQADGLMKGLRQEQFYFTVIDTAGGWINEPMICLLLGLARDRLPVLLDVVRQNCQPYKTFIPAHVQPPGEFSALPMVEARVGGALVYMTDVERFEQF